MNSIAAQKLVFIGGLHRSGTSLLARCLGGHPHISSFVNTGVPQDEGQHLQSVYPPANHYGGPGRFGFHPEAHLTETSQLVSEPSRVQLMSDWSRYWDMEKAVLLEKSPPNLIRARFLQALFPDAHFVMIIRHPAAVAYATQKWSRTTIDSLIQHWLVCHELFESDRRYVKQLHVLRYEDLTEQPQAALDGVFSFLKLASAACEVEIRPDVNEPYLRRWRADSTAPNSAFVSENFVDMNNYEPRVAAFGYELSASNGTSG